MCKRFHVTYEIVTPESADHGDVAENGFVDAQGTQHAMAPDLCGPAAAAWMSQFDLSLREAMNLFAFGHCMEDSGHWFTEADSDVDYRTGAETRMSFHPPRNITGASYQRIAALFHLA